MRQTKFHVNFDSLVPKSKLLAAGCGILISCLATILFVAPCYFLDGQMLTVYSVASYFLLPFAIGAVTTLMFGFHQKNSEFGSLLCSLAALLMSFITLVMIFPIKEGYTGAILLIFSPLSVFVNFIGTTVGCEYLSKKNNLDLK